MAECKLVYARGSINLVGDYIDSLAMKWKGLLNDSVPKAFFDNRIKRDGEHFHLTVFPKYQLGELAVKWEKAKETLAEEILTAASGVNLTSFIDVGVGKATDTEGNCAWFVIVSFEALRSSLKFFNEECKPVNFHITLAFNPQDAHQVPKDSRYLIVGPVNQNLSPGKYFTDEVKALIRGSHFVEALKIVECVENRQLIAEILEIKALLFFKLGNFIECIETAAEILNLPEVSPKIRVLAMIRQADALIALRKFRDALLPIWSASYSLKINQHLSELKSNAEAHLINSLKKCARNGYLRIDVLPVSRKEYQEVEKTGNVMIQDQYALKCFELFFKLNSEDYKNVLEKVNYGEVEHEIAFDENFMPLESRWISVTSSGKFHVLPRNFSYLWPNRLAVSSTPRNAEDIKAMAELGINLVITLTEEEPLKSEWFSIDSSCKNLFIPVPNYHPPSISAADRIVWEVAKQKNGKVLIHCGGGKGRAGTAAAVVIMTLGMDPKSIELCDYCSEQFRPFGTCSNENCQFSKTPVFDPISCLQIIRTHRPESLETAQQEAFLKTYSSALWQRSTIPKAKKLFLQEELNEDTLEVFGVLPNKLPRVLILSGLPGSGKTTFAKKLSSKLIEAEVEVDHINQDAIGGREAFENALGVSAKSIDRSSKSILIIDRCNARKKDRKAVLELLHNPEKEKVVLVHFDTSEEMCLQRIEQRFDHLTLKPEDGRRAVRHFSGIFEAPDQISEGVSSLLVVKSIADSEKAVELLSSSVSKAEKTRNSAKAEKMDKFYKFPRTEHLFNLGGATRDDLVLSPEAFKIFFGPAPGKVITMEEKIDGANVGFSMDENGKILCQNRSHYVDSKYHFQFQSLGSFIYQKRESLERVLQNGRILYGEWMFAKHSIHYTSLPDIFIAFDIFDPNEQKFLDRVSFREIMSTTNIAYVKPLVDNAKLYNTRESLENLLKVTKSEFSDSIIEGIYFRWDQNGRLKTRAKLVRSDFICGDDHWSKGKIVLNIVN